eukprot:CFRG3826T1
MLTSGDALLFNPPPLNSVSLGDIEFSSYLDPIKFFGTADLSLILKNDASSTDSGSDDLSHSPSAADAVWPMPESDWKIGQEMIMPDVPSMRSLSSEQHAGRTSFNDRSSFSSMMMDSFVEQQNNLSSSMPSNLPSSFANNIVNSMPMPLGAVKSEPLSAQSSFNPIASPVMTNTSNVADKNQSSQSLSVTETENVDEEDAARRRRAHLASEKKRRHNLKDAFDELKQTIPQCRNFPQSKSSKESVLRKAVDYISYLVKQRAQMTAEIHALRAQVKDLGGEPVGAPIMKSEVGVPAVNASSFPPGAKIIILLGLLDSFVEEFDKAVSVSSPEDFSKSLFSFFESYCQPNKMQNTIINSLKFLAINFNPTTDGASCRVRKWMDSLNGCDVSSFDENVSGRLRSVLASVYGHFSTVTAKS